VGQRECTLVNLGFSKMPSPFAGMDINNHKMMLTAMMVVQAL
jgi:hypothetical protein